jgi:tetratricopeptide (TPR) repeat protein
LKYLNKGVSLNEQNSNLLFYRGFVLYYMGQLDESLGDMDRAIEKSEDNIPKHFYARGLVYFQMENYKLALNDFSIAINLNENYMEAYLNRAKVFCALGDRGNAYYDAKRVHQMKTADFGVLF